jgi:hypothetical protein
MCCWLWHRTYVSKILGSASVVGIFTPHRALKDATGARKRKPLDPVVGYFPAIVDRETFDCVASWLGAGLLQRLEAHNAVDDRAKGSHGDCGWQADHALGRIDGRRHYVLNISDRIKHSRDHSNR